MARSFASVSYFESDLNQRIICSPKQVVQITIQAPKLSTEAYQQPHMNICICDFKTDFRKEKRDSKISCISNTLQITFKEATETLLLQVDLCKNPTAFVLFEFCGYLNGISSIIAWSAVSLTSGVDFTSLQQSKLTDLLQNSMSMMNADSMFSTSNWASNLQSLQFSAFSQPFKFSQFDLELYNKSPLFNNFDESFNTLQKLEKYVMPLRVFTSKVPDRWVGKLSTLPSNFLTLTSFLRTHDHAASFCASQHSFGAVSNHFGVGSNRLNLVLDKVLSSGRFYFYQKQNTNQKIDVYFQKELDKSYLNYKSKNEMKKTVIHKGYNFNDKILINEFVRVLQVFDADYAMLKGMFE
ncbi:Conserved_hypothetical protein [Hexamita inflata]|uniref:Uncharacterized protein n=1 Tax=Hexamita inflata TaxID=28002 RepID=A0AA86PUR6_9EUKA|nr:Conserved hypothetical protein [Hexamita inflata]